MIRRACMATLIAAVAFGAHAAAHAAAFRVPGPGGTILHDTIVVPAAWSGIWAITDSVYNCGNSTPISFSSDADTLCTGQSFNPEDTGGVTVTCTGSADDTHADITCTGSFEVFPLCTATYTVRSVTTRTGESYVATTTITTTYSQPGCGSFLQDTCQIINTKGMRTGPAPGNCLTPVQPGTWGAIKSLYR